jgi:hypothetical protein
MKLMALEKQMELFEDGGLMDEGGSVDPVSGNDVPTGSTQEEVRDDIPAQLSEGEFVLPADVVRYHGLEKIMELRDEAKAGLQKMEDMGQMGNAEEAVLPDDVPFSMEDLDLEDEPMEMQVGGFVPGQVQQSQFAGYQPQYTPYQMPQYTTPNYAGYQAPQQAAVPTMPTTAAPQFGQFVTPTYVTYVNDAGNTIQIPVGPDGQPLIPVPAGFKKQTETPTTPAVEQPVTTTAPVTQPSGSDDGGAPTPSAPRVDQFGREEDPRVTQVKSTQPFKDIQKTVDPRGMFEKIKDDFLGAVGMSTTSEEYQKAANQLAVDVANYTTDPEEQSQLLTQIKDMVGDSTRTARGMPLAPVVSGEEYDRQRQAAAPTATAVETARVTEKAGTTATEAAERRLEASKSDIAKRMDDIGLTGKQRKDFLNAIINQEKVSIDFKSGRGYPESFTGIMPDTTVDFTPATSIAQAQAQTGAAQRLLDEQVARERKTASDILSSVSRTPTTTPRFEPIDTEGVVEEETRIQQTRVARNERVQREAEEQTQNYRSRGYSETAAKQAGQNKARADDEAREQTGEPQAKAVTDKYGNPVRNKEDGSVVTSNREQKDDSPEPDSRWCCSQMVHRGLWTQQHEFARLTVWSSKQPDWWKSGYHVWGKVLAKTFLRKKGFWTDVMQSFYDYHIRKKPYTWRTAIAHVMVYPGVFICGNIWTKQPKGVTLASFKELNG